MAKRKPSVSIAVKHLLPAITDSYSQAQVKGDVIQKNNGEIAA